MVTTGYRWLLDMGVPRVSHRTLDVVHATELWRAPSHIGLQEAGALGRTLVTGDHEFRGPWHVPLEHAGVVVLDTVPSDAEEIERHLAHLEFRLAGAPAQGRRFVVLVDRGIAEVLPDGTEHDLESWRQVRVRSAPSAVPL